ncbi:MAG: phosphoribosylglycinamide formyltransferase [Sulfuricella sp.]|nr:phosphoribosylglycinamide formyltransferase [Sulfuricella sp.]
MKSIVILVSGRGSNMQALLEAKLPLTVAAVLSNKADAQALEIARSHGVDTLVVNHRDYSDREAFDRAMAEKIDALGADLVVLAGFMRILSPWFVAHYRNRLINIHPALLPAFTGLDTHARALADGVKLHGCTVHFVTNELDRGPIVAQVAVPVFPDDTEEILAARVLAQEHRIYPAALRWFAEDRLEIGANGVVTVKGGERPDTAFPSSW